MPIYEYKCKKCGKISEIIVDLIKPKKELLKCNYCGSSELKKLISAPGNIRIN